LALTDDRLKQNNDELTLTNLKLRQELEAVLIKLSQLEAQGTLFSAADRQLDDENKALKVKIIDLTRQLSELEVQKSTFDSSLNSQSHIALEEDNHLFKSQILDLKAALLEMKNVQAEFEKTKNDLELTKKKNEELLQFNEQSKIELAEFQENIQLKSLELENYGLNNVQLAADKENLVSQINDLTTKVSDLETYQAEILAKNEELILKISHEKAPESDATQALDDNNLKSDIESVMLLLSNGRFKAYRR
jgi:chromosome segregation ATPase